MKAATRSKFNPDRDFVCRRTFTIEARTCRPGDPFPKHMVHEKRLKRLFEQRSIAYDGSKVAGVQLDAEDTANDPVAKRRAYSSARAANFSEGAAAGALNARKALGLIPADDAKPKKKGREGKKKDKTATEPKNQNPAPSGSETPPNGETTPPPPPTENTGPADSADPAANVGDNTPPTGEGGTDTGNEGGNESQQQDGQDNTGADGAGDDQNNGQQGSGEEGGEGQGGGSETFNDAEAIAKARAAIVIPDDWASLPWPKRLSLAASLTDDKIKSGDKAAEVISAELARRGNP